MNLVLSVLLVGLFALPIISSPAQAQTRFDTRIVRTQTRPEVTVAPAPISTLAPVTQTITTATTKTLTTAPVQSSAPKTVAAQPAATQPVAQAPTKTTSTVAPASTFAQQVEQEIFRLINIERTKAGLSTLVPDTRLDKIARAHSADMLANGYFSHTDKSGCDSACRVSNAGVHMEQCGGEHLHHDRLQLKCRGDGPHDGRRLDE
jgi:uncharacterized protein YkwD